MKDRNIVNLRFYNNQKQPYFNTAYNKTSGVISTDYKDKLAAFINNLDKCHLVEATVSF